MLKSLLRPDLLQSSIKVELGVLFGEYVPGGKEALAAFRELNPNSTIGAEGSRNDSPRGKDGSAGKKATRGTKPAAAAKTSNR